MNADGYRWETICVHQCLSVTIFHSRKNHMESSAGEFHPHALAEPDLRLSPHPAPSGPRHTDGWFWSIGSSSFRNWPGGSETRPPRSLRAARRHLDKGARLPSWPVTADRHYYGSFRPCASHWYSWPRGVAACAFPFASRRQVPRFRV